MHRALLNFHAFSWETRPQGQKSVYGKQRPGAAAPSNGNQPVKENASEPNGCCGLPAPLWRMVLHPSAGRGEIAPAGRAARQAFNIRGQPGAALLYPCGSAPRPLKEVCLHHAGRRPPLSAVLRFCGSTVLRQKSASAKVYYKKTQRPGGKGFSRGAVFSLYIKILKRV